MKKLTKYYNCNTKRLFDKISKNKLNVQMNVTFSDKHAKTVIYQNLTNSYNGHMVNSSGDYVTAGSGGSAGYFYGIFVQSFVYNGITYTINTQTVDSETVYGITIEFSGVNLIVVLNYIYTDGDTEYVFTVTLTGNAGESGTASQATSIPNTAPVTTNTEGYVGAGGTCSLTSATNQVGGAIPPTSYYINVYYYQNGSSGSAQNVVGTDNNYTSSGSGINTHDYSTEAVVSSGDDYTTVYYYPDGAYTSPAKTYGMTFTGSNYTFYSQGGGATNIPNGYGAGGANVPEYTKGSTAYTIEWNGSSWDATQVASGSPAFCYVMYALLS